MTLNTSCGDSLNDYKAQMLLAICDVDQNDIATSSVRDIAHRINRTGDDIIGTSYNAGKTTYWIDTKKCFERGKRLSDSATHRYIHGKAKASLRDLKIYLQQFHREHDKKGRIVLRLQKALDKFVASDGQPTREVLNELKQAHAQVMTVKGSSWYTKKRRYGSAIISISHISGRT